MPDIVRLEKHDGIGQIILNSPPANALSDELMEQLQNEVNRAAGDSEIRSVLFRSEVPGIFMAGADLKKMLERTREGLREYIWRVRKVLKDIEAMPQPTIAAINGHALGGGCELAICCDFRFMATGKGRIGLPEVNLGIMPAAGGTERLPRLIGVPLSRDIIMMGKTLTAKEAFDARLVDRLLEPEGLFEESIKFASDLAQRPTRAISAIKECLRIPYGATLHGASEKDMENFLSLVHDTEDAREGIKAFNDKRKPEYRGR